MNDRELQSVFSGLNQERIFYHASLKECSTFHAGGPADVLFYPQTSAEIQEAIVLCKKNGIPFQILGRGSNVLISDQGIRGLTIYLRRNFNQLECRGNMIYANCGVSLAQIAAMAARNGLSGLEFASGIPGSLGGAILMNASAYDGETKNVVKSSTYLTEDGEIKTIHGEEHAFSYRHSIYSDMKAIILEAELELTPGSKPEIYEKINDFQVRRRTSQPLDKHSAGSAFKRPPGYYASKLIADAGLKGFRIDDAGVSEKHAGFIVNHGTATASEINHIFAHVKKTVKEKFDVSLETEVRWLGDWKEEETAWKLSY